MASIPTLNSTTAESAVLELVEFLADQQVIPAKNPQNRTLVSTYSRNNTTGAINISLNLTSSADTDASGNLVISVDEVFVD